MKLRQLLFIGDLAEAEGPFLPVEDLGLHVDDRRPRIADRREDAAPVRIAAEPARLRQRGLRNRTGRTLGVLRRLRALHRHRHELGRAFAVRRHLLRQRNADGFQRREKRVEILTRLHDLRIAGLAGRQQEERVVGRLVAVDDDPVEALVEGQAQRALQHRTRNRRVCRHKAEHRRHVGLDHARTLRHAADRHRLAADLHAGRGLLRPRVGRHHRLLGRQTVLRRGTKLRRGILHAGQQAVHRKTTADHPRRSDQHVLRRNAELARRRQRRKLRVMHAALARAGIGAAGVRENRLDLAALHDLAVIDDRRRSDLVGREDRSRDTRLVRHDQRDVVAALVLDFSPNTGGAETLRGTDAAFDDLDLLHVQTHLRSLIKTYLRGLYSGLYAGRMIGPLLMSSSMRCAHQLTQRAIAKSGV